MSIFKRVKSFFGIGATKRAEDNLSRRLAELKAEKVGPTPTEDRLTKLVDIARAAHVRALQPANAAIHSDDFGPQPATAEFVEEPGNDLEAFLYFGSYVYVQSSNVKAISYYAPDQLLTVEYKDSSVYEYSPVAIEVAEDFITAPSKGKWVWDNLRVRGTVFGYKVPYVLKTFAPGRHLVVGKSLRRPKGGRRTGSFVQPRDILMEPATRQRIEAAQRQALQDRGYIPTPVI